MANDTRAVGITLYERLNTGDVDQVLELLSDDYVSHGMGDGGIENTRQFLTAFLTAFPDMAWTVEDAITEDDKVALKHTFRGTHQGPFAGVPGTGNAVEVGGCDVLRVRNGKIVEAWWLGDSGSMFMQIGAMKAPAMG
jgi:steroid delta-isomerase-like uncharacterized protein